MGNKVHKGTGPRSEANVEHIRKLQKAVTHDKYKNFLISGTGRCGTRFLANLMDRSETWTVKHEPGAAGIENYTTAGSIDDTLKRFEYQYYGEVNSMLRRIFIHFPVAKRGLLIRNPYDVYLSIANRKQDTQQKFIDEFKESLGLMDYALSNKKFRAGGNFIKIEFEKLITDADYALEILKWFGITDVEIEKEDLMTKVNFTKEENRKYKSIKDLPPPVRKEILIASERFLESRAND